MNVFRIRGSRHVGKVPQFFIGDSLTCEGHQMHGLPAYHKQAAHASTKDQGHLGLAEGDVIVQIVGVIRKRAKPATKKAKPFEPGRTYKGPKGNDYLFVGFINEVAVFTFGTTPSNAVMYNKDGTSRSTFLDNIIPEYEEIPGGEELYIEEIK